MLKLFAVVLIDGSEFKWCEKEWPLATAAAASVEKLLGKHDGDRAESDLSKEASGWRNVKGEDSGCQIESNELDGEGDGILLDIIGLWSLLTFDTDRLLDTILSIKLFISICFFVSFISALLAPSLSLFD